MYKAAWPNSPSSVIADLEARAAASASAWEAAALRRAAAKMRRGAASVNFGKTVATSAGSAVGTAARAADRLLAPAGNSILRGLGHIGGYVAASPRLSAALASGAIAAPILLSDAPSSYAAETNQILGMRANPSRMVEERDVMASLNEFLEKKAAAGGGGGGGPRPPPRPLPYGQTGPWAHAAAHGIQGLTSGVGQGIAEALILGLGRAVGGAGSALFGDSKRKQILEKVLRSDQVLSDALKRNPATGEQLLEAYQTMMKFAPTLASDVNAVRSFLREVVLGGGHVNYATIKNLVDTEKAIHSDMPKYRGVF